MTADLLAALGLRLLADRYAMAVDRGDGAMFADQFVADGVLIAPRGRFEGREALSTVPPMMKRLYDRTHHAVVGQVPTFHDGGAQAQTYTLARHFYRRADGIEYCYEMTVRYEDAFRLTAEGWKIERRELVLVGEMTWPTGRLHPAGGTQ